MLQSQSVLAQNIIYQRTSHSDLKFYLPILILYSDMY